MGLYVEPITGDKPAWWMAHARAQGMRANPAFIDFSATDLPCAYLNNGAFQAIAVLWSKKEFIRVTSGRPDARLGLVAKDVLRASVPGGMRLKELK